MTIPSPRAFIEIAAFCFFAFCVCIGIIGAVALLALIWGAEKVIERAAKIRRRAA